MMFADILQREKRRLQDDRSRMSTAVTRQMFVYVKYLAYHINMWCLQCWFDLSQKWVIFLFIPSYMHSFYVSRRIPGASCRFFSATSLFSLQFWYVVIEKQQEIYSGPRIGYYAFI